jgi:polyhydroxybutyrate depolymerase
MARHRSQATPELQHRWLEIGPTPRSYWLAPAPQPHAPLLVVLHGLGMTGKDMAAFTGLATRGPAAGFTAVFPDGWEKVWNDGLRRPRRRGIDDTEFILALLDRLAADGLGRRDAVVLAGISNGASFAEHLSRHGLVEPVGLVLWRGPMGTRR